jgi:hypothetical protein
MNIVIAPIAESHASGFRACLDIVAREKRYLAQIEAPPSPSGTLRARACARVMGS